MDILRCRSRLRTVRSSRANPLRGPAHGDILVRGFHLFLAKTAPTEPTGLFSRANHGEAEDDRDAPRNSDTRGASGVRTGGDDSLVADVRRPRGLDSPRLFAKPDRDDPAGRWRVALSPSAAAAGTGAALRLARVLCGNILARRCTAHVLRAARNSSVLWLARANSRRGRRRDHAWDVQRVAVPNLPCRFNVPPSVADAEGLICPFIVILSDADLREPASSPVRVLCSYRDCDDCESGKVIG